MKTKGEQLDELLTAIGTTAEMSLNFYRAVLGAGATKKEAEIMTRAYIAALTIGREPLEEGAEET